MTFLERKKQEWLARYKSKAGTAIARRSWEACEAAIKEQKLNRQFKRLEKLRDRARAAGLVFEEKP